MSRDVVNATRIKPGTDTPNKFDFRVYCEAAINAYDILYVSGSQGDFLKVNKAINSTVAQTRGMLLMARSAGAANTYIRATAVGTIRDVDTSADTIGDAYYVGAVAGDVSKTSVGFGRRIGTVIKAATVANGGKILFDGFGFPAGGNNVVSGIATFTSASATVTVLAANIGGTGAGGAALGGRPVVACLNTTDTTNTILSAVWSGNDLVITRSAGSATTPTVAYFISVS